MISMVRVAAMRGAGMAILVFVQHGAARAQGLTSQDLAKLAAGKAVVSVMPDDRGADGVVSGVVDIPARPAVVWKILYDCPNAPKIMSNLKSCRVLQSEGGLAAKSDVREHQIVWTSLLPTVRSVFRSQYVTNSSIEFVKTDGGELTVLEGEWRLEPTKTGEGTRLLYRARFGFLPLMPSFLVRQSLAADFPVFLETIRGEALKRQTP